MRRIIALTAILTIGTLTAAYASAASSKESAAPIGIALNGVTAQIASIDQPFLSNNRVQVPVRLLFEALGANVQYDEKTRTVAARRGDTKVSLAIGGDKMQVGDRVVQIDSPALVRNGRTFVPVRAVTEAFGSHVEWAPAVRQVQVVSPLTRGAAPDAASMSDEQRAQAQSTSPYELAVRALHARYTKLDADGVVLASQLAADWEAADESYDRIWLTEKGTSESSDRFRMTFLVTGADAEGQLSTIGADVVEVTSIGSGKGYAVTGYAHLAMPGASIAGAADIWVGGSLDSSIAPRRVTEQYSAAWNKSGKVMLPKELLDLYGSVRTAQGTAVVKLADGTEQSFSLVRTNGSDYVYLSDLIRLMNGKTVKTDTTAARSYQVEWHAAAKQLILRFSDAHPVS